MRGVKTLISAASTTPIGDTVPVEIVYLPEGEHSIHPKVNGKPEKVTVKVPKSKGVAIAAALQADLVKRQGDNVRPIIDFDHKHSGPAAAIPSSFRYEEGKGIVMALDWTRAGREAIEGKDFSYFSPEFLMNDDGTPGGLPARGPLGSLVNNPAFREIPRIAASDSEGEEDPTNPTPTKPTMKRIAAHFKLDEGRSDLEDLILSTVTASESAAKEKIDDLTRQITALTTERDKLKGDLGEAETKVEAAAKEKAESLVAAACADGRIAPKDEKTKGFFLKLITAGDSDAVEALASLPKRAGAVPKIVQASDADANATGDHAFIAKAKRLVEAKSAENIDAAMDLVMASEPGLYDDYNKSLHIAAAE
jgi:phage I-like protein